MAKQIPEGVFFIESVHSGLVLDAKKEGKKNGTKIIVWPKKDKNNANQKFRFNKDRTIECIGNGLVLDTFYSFTGEEIVCWKPVPNKATQQWEFDGKFLCSKHSTGKVMDVRNESKKKGTQVILYVHHGKPNQCWKLVPTTEDSDQV